MCGLWIWMTGARGKGNTWTTRPCTRTHRQSRNASSSGSSLDHCSAPSTVRPVVERERTRIMDRDAGKNMSLLLGLEAPPPTSNIRRGRAELKQEHYITTANDTRMIAVAARRQQEHKTDTPQGSVNKVPLPVDRDHHTH